MKVIEDAVIEKLNDNLMNENQPIVSLSIKFEDSSIGGTMGYRYEGYNKFLESILGVLELEDKQQIEGKPISVCLKCSYGDVIAIRK